jgi:hypothetical protein
MTETSVVVPTRSHVVLFGHRDKDVSTPSPPPPPPSNNNAQRKQSSKKKTKKTKKKAKEKEESKCGFEGAVLLPGVKKDTFP